MSAAGSPTTVPTPQGLVLAPFRALRFAPDMVGDVGSALSPPYDVIDDAQRAELEQRSPHNVVRLILPRESADGGDRYRGAAALLAKWRADGVLVADDSPALYVYEETLGQHVQRGLLGGVALAQAEAGIVLPHENTMAGPVADRLALTEAVGANLEPIFLVYDGGGAASRLVASVGDRSPVTDVTTPDGVRHRLWAVSDPDVLEAVAADLLPRRAVIADGHHRYATYLRHQADRHAGGAGNGPWDFGLTFLVDASAFGPQVEPIHRVVPGLPAARAAELARAGFAVREVDGDIDAAITALATAGKAGTSFVVTDGTVSWLLTDPDAEQIAATLPAGRSAAWGRLDVTIAHLFLVRRLWKLEDSEQTVDYRHDVPAALRAAADSAGCALLLNPTPVEDVVAVAAAGDRMPRKSTLFVPKPATGLVIRAFADA